MLIDEAQAVLEEMIETTLREGFQLTKRGKFNPRRPALNPNFRIKEEVKRNRPNLGSAEEDGEEMLRKRIHHEDMENLINILPTQAETLSNTLSSVYEQVNHSEPDDCAEEEEEDQQVILISKEQPHQEFSLSREIDGVVELFAIQVIENHVKIKTGASNAKGVLKIEHRKFKDYNNAAEFLDEELVKRMNEGFNFSESEFKLDFDENEFTQCEQSYQKSISSLLNNELNESMSSQPLAPIKEKFVNSEEINRSRPSRQPRVARPATANDKNENYTLTPTIPTEYSIDNVDGWYMTYKVNGVQCIWDGKSLRSKTGKKYDAPAFFTADFPNTPLDGEVCSKDEDCDKVARVLKQKRTVERDWKDLVFVVFDIPKTDEKFIERIVKMKEFSQSISSDHLTFSKYESSGVRVDLLRTATKVEKEGGKGIILKDPKGFYEGGKSLNTLEINMVRKEDAKVIEIHPRDCEPIKRIKLRNASGVEFFFSVKECHRMVPFKIGNMIRYSAKSFDKKGVPRQPDFLTILPDTL